MDGPDEARLNDWIEGVASPADVAAVEAMLAGDPMLEARVLAMQQDCRAIQSLPTPAVPAELRAAVDDRVARILLLAEPAPAVEPMLAGEAVRATATATATAPGHETASWRDRRRRELMARRWTLAAVGSLAAAAVVGFVVLVDVMPGEAGVTGPPSAEALAAAGDADGSRVDGVPAEPGVNDAAPFRPSRDTVVVHGLPLPTAPPATVVATAPSRSLPLPPSGAAGEAGAAVPAIRISGFDAETLQTRLRAAVDSAGGRGFAALTRNLTTEAVAEALPPPGEAGSEPLWADLEPGRSAADADWGRRVEPRLERVMGSGRIDRAGGDRDGTVLAGAADARPSWGDQIVFSESGAVWTMSVRADQAVRALETLAAIAEGGDAGVDGSSTLVLLDPVRWRVAAGTEAWRSARSALRELSASDPSRIVHLPIVLADE